MNKQAAQSVKSETASHILEVAERLAQTRGFNGFSYADIAAELKITKASLHYHFATKAELGCALIVNYTGRFNDALAKLDVDKSRLALHNYVQLYEQVLVRDRMCLCGMLAAEYSTLPSPMQREIRHFFDENETWLSQCMERGRSDGSLHFDGSVLEAARALTAGLEGAMLLARSYEDPARFTSIAKRLLAELGVARPRRRANR
ncbi:MAG TPA: TetR/AcrR family transcriptional regulator [Steroidobacteraceae bacterium]|jgi:TetR/AcrR family transcriptional repressor of nem operon